eukprot:s2636_g16.t1
MSSSICQAGAHANDSQTAVHSWGFSELRCFSSRPRPAHLCRITCDRAVRFARSAVAVATAKARRIWCPSGVQRGASGPYPSSGADFVEVKDMSHGSDPLGVPRCWKCLGRLPSLSHEGEHPEVNPFLAQQLPCEICSGLGHTWRCCPHMDGVDTVDIRQAGRRNFQLCSELQSFIPKTGSSEDGSFRASVQSFRALFRRREAPKTGALELHPEDARLRKREL